MVFKRVTALLFIVLFSLTGTAKGADYTGTVGEFLKRTTLSERERTEVMEALKAAPPGTRSRTEWLLSGDGEIYSLALRRVQKDNRPSVQVRLEEVARTQANLRAHYLIYLRAIPQTRKARYANEESVAEALAEWDGARGEAIRLNPNLSVSVVSGDWAFALVRTKGELLNSFSAQIESLPDNALDTAYCAALYPKAKALFDDSEYEKALPVYLELHALRWAKPVAYLDAAECFLHTGDKEGAATLAEETVAELGDGMNVALLERAGDILLESGKEEKAELVYRLALEKLRQE